MRRQLAGDAGRQAYIGPVNAIYMTPRIAANSFPLTRNPGPEIGNPLILNFVEGWAGKPAGRWEVQRRWTLTSST